MASTILTTFGPAFTIWIISAILILGFGWLGTKSAHLANNRRNPTPDRESTWSHNDPKDPS